MLSKRFQNDGKSTEYLNRLQAFRKKQVKEKISKGTYRFEKVPCLLCRASDFLALSEKDRYGLFHRVVLCRNCGLVQQNPRLTQDSYNSFYGSEYRELYTGSSHSLEKLFSSQYQRAGKVEQYLATNLKISLSGKRICEVGCGTGGILQYFRERGAEVFGFDIDQEDIRFGREKHELSLQRGTLDTVSLPWAPDIIIYSHVLEHFLDPVKELEKLKQFLKKNSRLYIEVPGVFNLKQSYGADFLRMLQNAHVSYFTLSTLTGLLNAAGYSLVCGNEDIQSIARVSEKESTPSFDSASYQETVAFLERMEWFRFVPTISTLKFLAREQARKLLGAMERAFDQAP